MSWLNIKRMTELKGSSIWRVFPELTEKAKTPVPFSLLWPLLTVPLVALWVTCESVTAHQHTAQCPEQ